MGVMEVPGRPAYLRPCTEADEAFVYDVFATTWEKEVAAMPNQTLVTHFLRIQYIAQERRFNARYPKMDRYIIMHEGERVGRFYLHRTEKIIHAVDMTVLPKYRSQGIGSQLAREVFAEAAEHGQTVCLRVARRNTRAKDLYEHLGFRLVTMDDMDCYFEWTPQTDAVPAGPMPDVAFG
jgi:ribosomal protein S18 acetylase RimI-like enzyme